MSSTENALRILEKAGLDQGFDTGRQHAASDPPADGSSTRWGLRSPRASGGLGVWAVPPQAAVAYQGKPVGLTASTQTECLGEATDQSRTRAVGSLGP